MSKITKKTETRSAPSSPPGRRCTTQTKQTIVYLHRQRRTHDSIFPMLLLYKKNGRGMDSLGEMSRFTAAFKDIGH